MTIRPAPGRRSVGELRLNVHRFDDIGDAPPVRDPYLALITASRSFDGPLCRLRMVDIDHELKTFARVTVGAQQSLEHADAVLAHRAAPVFDPGKKRMKEPSRS